MSDFKESSHKGSNTTPLATLGGCGCLAVIGLVIFMLLPEIVDYGKGPPRRMLCTNNLKQLALAMHTYNDYHKSFPPAYTTDEDGKPLHSWRVLILPFIEQRGLYESIRLDEPCGTVSITSNFTIKCRQLTFALPRNAMPGKKG